MNRPANITGATERISVPHSRRGSAPNAAPIPSAHTSPVLATHSPDAEAGRADDLRTFQGDPPNFIELGYGTGVRCIRCRRNFSGCFCDSPEPEQEHFVPGIRRDPDWYRIEL
jgi:hypothetical protein